MLNFLKQFLSNPIKTGAVAPSSKGLAELITDSAQLSKRKCVVELGSGSGSFTGEIIRKIPSKSLFFSIEINSDFVNENKKKNPNAIIYQASAKDIKKYLSKHGKDSCDCIISGLPFAGFDEVTQKELLDAAYDSLEDEGVFLTFAYSVGLLFPPGRRFKKMLKQKFKSVKKTKVVWKNLPPAFVYVCKK